MLGGVDYLEIVELVIVLTGSTMVNHHQSNTFAAQNGRIVSSVSKHLFSSMGMCPSNHLFHDQRDSFSQEKIYDAFVEAPGEVVNGNLVEKTC